jgi:hypothetical protein
MISLYLMEIADFLNKFSLAIGPSMLLFLILS